jgi:hypothetical protein
MGATIRLDQVKGLLRRGLHQGADESPHLTQLWQRKK